MKHKNIIRIMFMIISCIILCSCSSSKEQNKKNTTTPSVKEEKTTVYIPYINLMTNISAEIPSDWIQTTENNQFIITERNTGTYISFTTEKYTPEINNYSQETLSQRVNGNGITLQSFVKETGNNIKLIISYTVNNTPITEYQYIYWTYNTIYTISYISETVKTEAFFDVFEKVYESFSLNQEEPVLTEGYTCIYNPEKKISIEYPINWEYNSIDTGFYLDNTQTKSSIYVETTNPIEQFDKYTQIDYQKIIQNISSGAYLSSFLNNGEMIYGEAYFSSGTNKCWIENVLIDKKTYTLCLTYLSFSDYTSIDEGVFSHILDSIKYYS